MRYKYLEGALSFLVKEGDSVLIHIEREVDTEKIIKYLRDKHSSKELVYGDDYVSLSKGTVYVRVKGTEEHIFLQCPIVFVPRMFGNSIAVQEMYGVESFRKLY